MLIIIVHNSRNLKKLQRNLEQMIENQTFSNITNIIYLIEAVAEGKS